MFGHFTTLCMKELNELSVHHVSALKENQTTTHFFNACFYLFQKLKEFVKFVGIDKFSAAKKIVWKHWSQIWRISLFSPLLYEKLRYTVKPNEDEC